MCKVLRWNFMRFLENCKNQRLLFAAPYTLVAVFLTSAIITDSEIYFMGQCRAGFELLNCWPFLCKRSSAAAVICRSAVLGSADLLFVMYCVYSFVKRLSVKFLCISYNFNTDFYMNVTTLRSGMWRRKSASRLSVCNFRTPYSACWNFRQCLYAILYLAIC